MRPTRHLTSPKPLRSCAALAAGFVIALATSSGALADGGSHRAFVTPTLTAAVERSPDALFQVIVKGNRGVTTAAVAADEKSSMTDDPALDAKVKKQFKVVNATASLLSGKQIEKLARQPHIASIVEDSRTRGLDFSNSQSWPAEAGVSSLWSSNLLVPAIAVVDSGIDASRAADFGGRVLASADMVSSGVNTPAGDDFGHGTMVASIAAGSAPGHAGAAP